jgi:PAS domain S-box-containing protein
MGEKTKVELAKEISSLIKQNKTLQKKLEACHTKESESDSANLINSAFDNANIGMVIISNKGFMTRANKYITRILGYSQIELSKMMYTDISHPHDKDISIKMFKEILSGKRDYYQLEKRYIHKNGKIIWGRVSVTAVKDKDNKIKYFVAIAEDLSAQREIRSKLASEERLLKTMMHNIPDSIYFKDLEGKYLIVNYNKARRHGYVNPEELVGKSDIDLFDKVHAAKAMNDEQQIIITGKPIIALEEMQTYADGKTVWVSTTKMPLYDEENSVIGTFGISRDITEQKDTERIIRENETRFKELFNNMSSGCAIYEATTDGSDFIFKNFNQVSEDFLKIKKENVIGRSILEVFPGVKEFGLFDVIQRVWKTGKPELYPVTSYKDNRITGWYENYVYKLPSGEIVAIYDDVTSKKQAENALINERERYRVLFENSADGIFIMTDLFEDCNKAALEIFSCSREELIGHHPAEFSPEFQPDGKNSTEKANEIIKLALSGKPQNFYWKHLRKSGELFDADVTLNAIILEGRNLIQASVRDISEQKYAEKLEKVIYKISEAAQTSEDINKLYKRLHEIISELLPVKNFYIALYDEKADLLTFPYFVDEFDPPQPPKKLGRGMTEYVIRKGEAVLIDAKKDLELREKGEVELIGAPQAIWLGVPLKLNENVIGVMVVQDYEDEKTYGEKEKQLLIYVSEQITQAITRKQNSEAIKRYVEELNQLNATKDKFFSIIAHDLKNPFITILGFSDLLLGDFHELNDDEKLFYISEMKKSAEISHNLLHNLLQWSRSQTGRIEFNPANINLANLIKENINLLNATAANKKIELINEIPENTFVFADEEMTKTVFRNLISNAIKFTPKGGKVKICSRINNGTLETCVEDTGIGMDKETMGKLFRLDVSHSSQGTDEEAGTGLGLILCKEFIEKNGGTIRVESEPSKGSRFICTIPTKK